MIFSHFGMKSILAAVQRAKKIVLKGPKKCQRGPKWGRIKNIKIWLYFHFTSLQPQPQYQPQLNLNLNSIWL